MAIDAPQAALAPEQAHGPAHEIRPGMTVCCQEGTIGRVAGLAPAWASQPTHLVVQTGPLIPRKLVLPLHWVARVTQNQVVLQVRRRHTARIRPHSTDELLQDEVREALYNTSQFRQDDAFLMIDVAVTGQVVTLRGNVRTLWRVLLAETIARQVRGVWNVQNLLVGDDELEDGVLQTLRRDPRLHRSTLQVQALLGQVILRGKVPTGEHAGLAMLLARHVPGVRTIDNQIVVSRTSNPEPSIDGHTLFALRRTLQARAS